MAVQKLGFDEFIASVPEDCVDFVKDTHTLFTGAGCKIVVKEAKSGYVVSYVLNKKTVVNYVFRKQGLIIRIYANHVINYIDFLDTLPDDVKRAIKDTPDCRRLIDPNACNPKCAMGFDFVIDGARCQKCRYTAFMILVDAETKPHIRSFLERELKYCV